MENNIGRPPESWRNFSDKVPLAAMVLERGDLKKIYRIVNGMQIEMRDRFIPVLAIQRNELLEEFEARKSRVFNVFATSMTIHRTNGEYLHGNNEQFLDDVNLPNNIRAILFSTTSVPRTLGIEPISKIDLFLDFTSPPLFDFSRLPSFPTVNESNFEVASDSEPMFVAARARLIDFFNERKSKVNWLHGGYIYDISVFFLGLPFAILSTYRASQIIGGISTGTNIISNAIYVYIFFFSLHVERFLFMYSRWVFPKIELKSEKSSPLRHRGVWAAIVLAILVGILTNFIWTYITK